MGQKKEMKISKYMKAPIKILVKAKDLYIRSLTRCSNNFDGHATAFGFPTVYHVNTLPRSFSTSSVQSRSSSGAGTPELVRAASVRNMAFTQVKPGDLDATRGRGPSQKTNFRNNSVGIGRIDENKACESFGEKNHGKFWRSKSYNVSKNAYAI